MTAADSDRAAFVRAIIAAPDDDLPRLIYADFLDEHGQNARPEFIRVQCELARHAECFFVARGCDPASRCSRLWSSSPTHPVTGDDLWCTACRATDALRRRERELLDVWRDEWILPTPFETQEQWDLFEILAEPNVCTFRRGFVESVTLIAADWLWHQTDLRTATPLRHVTLTTPLAVRIYPGEAGYCVLYSPGDGRGYSVRVPGLPVSSSRDHPTVEECCKLAWPGVTFEMQPASSATLAVQESYHASPGAMEYWYVGTTTPLPTSSPQSPQSPDSPRHR